MGEYENENSEEDGDAEALHRLGTDDAIDILARAIRTRVLDPKTSTGEALRRMAILAAPRLVQGTKHAVLLALKLEGMWLRNRSVKSNG